MVGAKRCTKGKSCGATCIDPRERCILEMGEPISASAKKVVNMLNSRRDPNSSAATPKAKEDQPAQLSEKQLEKAATQERLIDRRVNKKLGGTPFEDPNPESEAYKRNLPLVKPFMGLDSKEKAAIGLYGENFDQYYKDVNTMLRSGKGSGDSEKDNMSKFISENLQKGLSRLPAAPGEYERAVSGSFAQQLSGLNPGNIIQDKGFGSYTNQGAKTLNMYISKDQPNAIIKIVSKTARNVSPVMEFDEGEHLSLPGTQYRLRGIDPEGFQSAKSGGSVPVYTFEEI